MTNNRPARPRLTKAEREHRAEIRHQAELVRMFIDSWHCAVTLRISAWRDEILAELSDVDRTRFLAIERTYFAPLAVTHPALWEAWSTHPRRTQAGGAA